MDYKESIKAISWHAKYAKFGGTTFRVYMLLLTSANYKTGECRFSYDELVKQLGCAKSAATKAIGELAKLGSIECKEKAMGRTPALYKIRSVEDLNLLHMVETINPDNRKWNDDFYSKFGEFKSELDKIGASCERCYEDDDDLMCPQHEHEHNQKLISETGRKMKVWMSDYPEPPVKVNTIFGRVV